MDYKVCIHLSVLIISIDYNFGFYFYHDPFFNLNIKGREHKTSLLVRTSYGWRNTPRLLVPKSFKKIVAVKVFLYFVIFCHWTSCRMQIPRIRIFSNPFYFAGEMWHKQAFWSVLGRLFPDQGDLLCHFLQSGKLLHPSPHPLLLLLQYLYNIVEVRKSICISNVEQPLHRVTYVIKMQFIIIHVSLSNKSSWYKSKQDFKDISKTEHLSYF